MLFEVWLTKGLGGPYYVDAADAKEAAKIGTSRYRYHCTALDFMPVEEVVKEVKPCYKEAVQYA